MKISELFEDISRRALLKGAAGAMVGVSSAKVPASPKWKLFYTKQETKNISKQEFFFDENSVVPLGRSQFEVWVESFFVNDGEKHSATGGPALYLIDTHRRTFRVLEPHPFPAQRVTPGHPFDYLIDTLKDRQ